jgi:DNA-binding transcriptional ArsR family regulator
MWKQCDNAMKPFCLLCMDTLPEAALEYVARYFRSLSDPMRLRILNCLRLRPHNVGELVGLLACSQANVSKHVSVLVEAGIVAREFRGTSTILHIADPNIFSMCELVCDNVARALESSAQAHQVLTALPDKTSTLTS